MTSPDRGKLISLDLDDSLYLRDQLTRTGSALLALLRMAAQSSKNSEYSQKPSYPPTGVWDRLSRLIHSLRQPDPQALSLLQSLQTADIRMDVNTGRPDTSAWRTMTRHSMQKHGLDPYIATYHFRPPGLTSSDSKSLVISPYMETVSSVACLEDDVHTALRLSLLYPELQVYLRSFIQTRLVIARSGVAKLPNVTVISSLMEIPPHLCAL